MLIVLNTNCGVGPTLHHCTQPSISNIRFYDIARPRTRGRPKLLNQFNVDTHEFFLWEDPKDSGAGADLRRQRQPRPAATSGGAPSCPFSVWDISQVPDGEAAGDAVQRAVWLSRRCRLPASRS